MIGFLITLLVLCVLWVIPIGVTLQYYKDSSYVGLKLGFINIRLYPKPKKAEKEKKKPKKTETAQTKKSTQSKAGSLSEFIPVVNIVLDFLSDFRRKLWVQDLELKIVLAGDDPCDLGVHYGEAWAALGNLFPHLERFVKIKKRNLEVLCDFAASKTQISAHANILITFGDFLIIALRHGVRGLKEYLKLSKKIKAVQ